MMKPYINLPFSMLPEAKDWKPGELYQVTLTLRQTSTSEHDASFEVIGVSAPRKKELKTVFPSSEGVYVGHTSG